LWGRAVADPWRAGRVLSAAQRELRSLRSRQRRLVISALYDLIRHQKMLERLTGSHAFESLWIGWMVRCGLAPDEAPEGSWGPCADWDRSVHAAMAELGSVDAVALAGSLEPWVAARLVDAFGPEQTLQFIDASNQRGPVVLRVNPLKASVEQVRASLDAEGIGSEPGTLAPHALVLEGRANLPATRAFRDGWFEVQDEGSQLLAEWVEATGLVVDLCAGAGGKTLALHGAQRLVACDVRERALRTLKQRARRAGVAVQTHLLGDQGTLPPEVAGLRADRVLVDAPCTGTGVLRRHPEHRWLVDETRVAECVALQDRILERAATLVKTGGRLIYATCSVLPAENEEVVERFLSTHPGFEPLGDPRRVAPHTHGTDGFFAAVLTRR